MGQKESFNFDQELQRQIRSQQFQEFAQLEREKQQSLKSQLLLEQLDVDFSRATAKRSPYPKSPPPKMSRSSFSADELYFLNLIETAIGQSLGHEFSKQQFKKTLKEALKITHPDSRKHKVSTKPGSAETTAKTTIAGQPSCGNSKVLSFPEVFAAYQRLKKFL